MKKKKRKLLHSKKGLSYQGLRMKRKRANHKHNVQKNRREYNAGYDHGFDKGFDEGHQKGFVEGLTRSDAYRSGYEAGYEAGNYCGGEEKIEKFLPSNTALLDVSIDQVIAAGVDHYKSYLLQLLSAPQVFQMAKQSVDQGAPFSLVRLGDGELLTLAQGKVLSETEIARLGAFLPYAGVNIPDYDARDLLLHSMQHCSVIGIPDKRLKTYQLLAVQIFRAYNIPYRTLQLTNSLINYQLYDQSYLQYLCAGRKVACIGNLATPLANRLREQGYHVTAVIEPVGGIHAAMKAVEIAGEKDFEIALVSAGIAAVVICEQLASRYGKVAIDFGHLADRIVSSKE